MVKGLQALLDNVGGRASSKCKTTWRAGSNRRQRVAFILRSVGTRFRHTLPRSDIRALSAAEMVINRPPIRRWRCGHDRDPLAGRSLLRRTERLQSGLSEPFTAPFSMTATGHKNSSPYPRATATGWGAVLHEPCHGLLRGCSRSGQQDRIMYRRELGFPPRFTDRFCGTATTDRQSQT